MIPTVVLVFVICASVSVFAFQFPILQWKVESLSASWWDVHDPEVEMYNITFALRVSNTGVAPVEIGAGPSFVPVVEVRSPTGWEIMNQRSWISTKPIHYAPCRQVEPGKDSTVPRIQTGLTLTPHWADKVGREPVVRFRVELFCRDAEGKPKRTHVLVTEEVKLKLLPPR